MPVIGIILQSWNQYDDSNILKVIKHNDEDTRSHTNSIMYYKAVRLYFSGLKINKDDNIHRSSA